jgi:glycosyltransferase involved in cell wall biosynthesis
MRIALCKNTFAGPVSGADEALTTYATTLHARRYDVHVVLLFPCADDDPYYIRLKDAGVSVSFVLKHSPLFELIVWLRNLLATVFFFIFFIPRVKELLRGIWQGLMDLMTRPRLARCRNCLNQLHPDILHVFTPDDGARLMIRAGHDLGIPTLYHELGTANHLPMLAGYYRRLGKVLPLCTEVAALSPRLASEWAERFPFLNSISVVPLIIERTRAFNLSSQIPRRSAPVVFGFAGRVEEAKGTFVLLDAMKRVSRHRHLAVARIAGAGPELAKAKARARELKLQDTYEFVGHYSEPLGRTAFMNSLDVFVLPSLAEGTPNGIIEAMAHGIPVIATPVGGIPDIVDADSGILVPPGDAASLAAAMLLLARDPARRKAIGIAARQRYEKLFSPAAVFPLMLQTYGRVAGNGHALIGVSENNHQHPWVEIQIKKREGG